MDETDENFKDTVYENGLYSFGLFYPQLFLPKEVEKRIKNFVYSILIYDLENVNQTTAISKQLVFTPKIIKFQTEGITGCEFYRKGDAKLRVIIKRLFSDEEQDDDEEQVAQEMFNKVIMINSTQQEIKQAIIDMNLTEEYKAIVKMRVPMNSYNYIDLSFFED